jgi:hypothetical protein
MRAILNPLRIAYCYESPKINAKINTFWVKDGLPEGTEDRRPENRPAS